MEADGLNARWNAGSTTIYFPSGAHLLDICEEAVRKPVRRGTVPSEVGEDGRRHVWVEVLDADPDEGEDPYDEALSVVEVMREEIAHLRRESERKDAIIMRLSESKRSRPAPSVR